MEENKKEEKKKLNIKERWKDKRERAKIELMLYGIFFLVIIIFARISSSMSTNIPKDNDALDGEAGLNKSFDDVYPNAVVKISRDQYSAFEMKRMVEETQEL